MKPFHAGFRHPAIAHVERCQFLERCELRQACIRDMTPIQIQLAQMRHAGESVKARIGNFGPQQVQFSHGSQVLQRVEPAVRHLHAIQIQLLDPRQTAQVCEAVVGHGGITQIEPL